MYSKIFKKTTLYVVRTDANGNFRNSAPCINCFNMIEKLKIKKIVYSTNDDFVCCKPCEFTTNHVSQGNRYLENKENLKPKTPPKNK